MWQLQWQKLLEMPRTCPPSTDEDEFKKEAQVRVVKWTHCHNVRFERKTSQAPRGMSILSKVKGEKEATKKEVRQGRGLSGGSCCHTAENVPVHASSQPSFRWLYGGQGNRKVFSQLRSTNSALKFLCFRLEKVTKEVPKLDLNKDSKFLLAVGGNEPFLKNGKYGSSEGLLGDFGRLIKTAKSKTSRLVVVGLTPRKSL